MRGSQLLDVLEHIHPGLIQEADRPYSRKAIPWKKWAAAAACLALVCVMAVSYFNSIPPDETTPGTTTPGTTSPGVMPWGKGIRPVLLFNGKLYHWANISVELQVYENSHGKATFFREGGTPSSLPEGCAEVGWISGVTQDTPTEELQLQAEFDTMGKVYQNPDTPEVVYAQLLNGWGSTGGFFYVRFVTEELGDGQRLCWQGRQYRMDPFGTRLTELPQGAELLGYLTCTGTDTIPTGDLATNNLTFSLDTLDRGKAVLAVPGDDSTLYVYAHYYWAGGDYPTWVACPLWDAAE